MPIANCIITSDCIRNADSTIDLIELWSIASKISPEHMTVNILASTEQVGNRYPAIATLLLPSSWSKSNVSSLQVGLSKALQLYFNLQAREVLISTCIIESGMVVESDKELKW